MRRALSRNLPLLIAITCISALEAQTREAAARKKGPAVRVKGSADRIKTGALAFDAPSVNNAAWTRDVGPGSPRAIVLRVQILLDRARYSPGEMDARYGRNTTRAVQGFQAARGLDPTGIVDERTWGLLTEDREAALTLYVVKDEDVAGPFVKIPNDMMEKSKLKALGFESGAEALGEKFHTQPALLAALNPGKDIARAGEEIMAPSVRRDAVPGLAERIVVSKTRGVVQALAPNGAVLAQYPATMGSDKDPLPLGTWKVTVVQENPVFHYNPDLFWDADPSHARARIAPGPNNPVGVVWIGLSKDHFGIHGSPEPGLIGHTQSHGCVRLTNWDAKDLAAMLKPGREAVLQEE